MNAHALLQDLRAKGVTLEADGLTLRVAAPEDVATVELHETVSRHKHALIRLLERERQRLVEAERIGLLMKWGKAPGYAAIHDPTTGEWHDVPATGCLPSVVESTKAHRQRCGQRR